MSEPNTEREAALRQIATRWDDQRTERTLAEAHGRRRRRKARKVAFFGVTALAGASGLILFVLRAHAPELAHDAAAPGAMPAAGLAAQPGGAAGQAMQLADGSQVALLDASTRVVVKEVSARAMNLELASGHARFDVVHRAERRFRVTAGEVAVEVLGTVFEPERDGARTRVAVERGRVAVRWAGRESELRAGEAGWFPKPVDVPEAAAGELDEPESANGELDEPESKDSAAPTAKRGGGASKPHGAGPASALPWRERAERGDFAHAYELLRQAKQPALDDVEELMLAADTARLSGHPAAALPFLNQVVAQHAKDARAPLAAFTLGGILMQQLGRPADAEAAYAKARALALNSSLAQDALARQVEAAHRAGDAQRARALAEEYLARYPNGRRVHAVRRFAGLGPE